MRIKTFVAAMLLMGGATGVYAQTENCNKNTSISSEAVKTGNFKDAYEPCMAVLKDCPTLRYFNYTNAMKILRAFMDEIKDKNSADYQKYFNELMGVYDQEIKYLPDFNRTRKNKLNPAKELGKKAIDYIKYAPNMDNNQAYTWLKEAAEGTAADPDGAILHHFLDASMKKVKGDAAHTDQFFQDYIDASKYADDAIAAETDEKKKGVLTQIKDNLVAMFINSGVADCESLQNIYGPRVEENKTDSVFLKKAVNILKMMGCRECEAYFNASDYLYKINPSADAAVGVAMMQYKKGNFDAAVKYFDEALSMETDNAKKAEMAYATSAALFSAKKLGQAKSYCLKAISFKEDYGEAYILLAQMYASNPHWNDEAALNKCVYFVAIDKLQRAKSVDPSVTEKANELISTYSRYTPQAKDLFMLGYKAGDRISIGGWIGESTTIR